jgi:glycosyltransferase involved in cell wall biosynthesis
MMSSTRDVSVIIPYHNREDYIDETVQSVLTQTLKPLEIIIVNDRSRESSRRYLERYAGICKIIDLPENLGVSAARNEGIRHARGQFMAFLDDDDLWLPQKLEIQRKYMEEHPDCAATHSAGWKFFVNKPETRWPCDWPPPLTLAQALTYECNVMPSTMLIRADVMRKLGGYDPKFRGSGDHDFAIRCCAAGYRIEGSPEPLARLRREEHSSITKRRWRVYRTDFRLLWKHKSHFYHVYGLRGILNFLLITLHLAAFKTRYVDGAVRLLLRLVKVKWEVRPHYQEPVFATKTASTVVEGHSGS